MEEIEIKPVVLSVTPEFVYQSTKHEWGVEYLVILADELRKHFYLRKMKKVPITIGYDFWVVARSSNFTTSHDNISEEDLNKAIILPERNDEEVRKRIERKVDLIGKVSWSNFEKKAAKFLNISDISDEQI